MKKSKDMNYHIGLELRLYPDRRGQKIIKINSDISRRVYNILVGTNKEISDLNRYVDVDFTARKRVNFLKTYISSATNIKNMNPYMYDKFVDSDTIANAISDYKVAWNLFWKNPSTKPPKFHKKGYEEKYSTSNHYSRGKEGFNDGSIHFIGRNKLQLPKIGVVTVKGSLKMIDRVFNHKGETRITRATIKKDSIGRYFVTLSVASDTPFFEHNKTGAIVGIDVNLTNLYTDSNKKVVANPKIRRKAKKKLAKKQKKLSKMGDRAQKEDRSIYESKNYQKQRKKVARLQLRNAAYMEDYLHIQTKDIVESQDYIFVEDIKVKNMLKNQKLAYAISDVSWGKFFQQLEQKANSRGKIFMKVPAKNTTQTCNICGYVCKGKDYIALGIEEWVCPNCGSIRPRDYNAATNILSRGIEIISKNAK